MASLFDQALAAFQSGNLGKCVKLARRNLKSGARGIRDYELLAEAQSRLGMTADFVKTLRKAITDYPNWIAGLLRLAQAAAERGKTDHAISYVERALRCSDMDDGLRCDAAQFLMGLGQNERAVPILEDLSRRNPGNPMIAFLQGEIDRDASDFESASKHYMQALDLAPDMTAAGIHLTGTLLQLGKVRDAVAASKRLVEAAPALAEGWYTYGIALARDGDNQAAADAYRECIRLRPDHVDALVNLMLALQRLGRHDEAVRVHEASEINPMHHREYAVRLASALKALERYDEAVTVCRTFRTANPANFALLAIEALICREMGDHDMAQWLLDLDNVLYATTLESPPGFENRDAFIESLADHIRRHPSLKFSPEDHATANGYHTGNIFDAAYDDPVVRALRAQILLRLGDYLSDVTFPAGHPYQAVTGTDDLAIVGWGVLMNDMGHQIPHIHPASWMSGVCYVALPGCIGDDDADHAGWIEFGRQPEEYFARSPDDCRLIRPELGKLVLFPSYLYHRTIPFRSEDHRISIAFDLIPRHLLPGSA